MSQDRPQSTRCRSRKLGSASSLLLLLSLWVPPVGGEEPKSKPLSSFERSAALWVADYLANDPELADDPLASELTRLFGDPAGSTWSLLTPASSREEPGSPQDEPEAEAYFEVVLPTGVEHWLRLSNGSTPGATNGALDTTREGMSPDRLLLASESGFRTTRGPLPSSSEASSPDAGHGASLPPGGMPGSDASERPEHQRLAMGLLLAAVVLFGLAFLDRRARSFFQSASLLVAVFGAALYFGWLSGSISGPESAGNTPAALEDGASEEATSRNRGLVPQLESAQRALAGRRLGEAERHLAKLSASPAAGLLEARLSFERLEIVEAALAYEQQLELWPSLDSILYEITRAFETLDYDDRAEVAAERLADSGSRRAEVHYYLARRALVDRSTSRALDHLRLAWQLEPRHRESLLRDPALAYLIFESTQLRDRLGFDAPAEPEVACGEEPDPRTWPKGATVHTLGGLLWVELARGSRLEVPGGCGLAPAGHQSDDAESWRRRREGRVLERLASLGLTVTAGESQGGRGAAAEIRTAPEPGSGVVPWSVTEEWPRSRMAEAVEVLARRRGWQALVDLTEGVPTEALDTESARWRALALQSIGREDDAGRLLVELVSSDAHEQRADPTSVLQLAEWLVKEQDYERALELLARIDDQVPWETSGRRLLQVRMERRLFRSAAEESSAHFRLIFPPELGFLYADETLGMLETGRTRLERWIPRRSPPVGKIDVLMFDANDFRASYGGLDVLGLFDGRIRLPLGELPTPETETPEIGTIPADLVTHELAHALLAEATGNRAPHWFQEGLAQHVEPSRGGINPIPGLVDRGTWIPFPLIEPVLKYGRLPEVTAVAYDQVRWILYWIETRHGIAAIHGLIDAFRRGSRTEEALAEVLSMTPADLDREVIRWGLEEAPQLRASFPSVGQKSSP